MQPINSGPTKSIKNEIKEKEPIIPPEVEELRRKANELRREAKMEEDALQSSKQRIIYDQNQILDECIHDMISFQSERQLSFFKSGIITNTK